MLFKKLKTSSAWWQTSLLIVIMFIPAPALAGPGLPFGGQIIATIPCICSLNLLIINRPIGNTSYPFLIFGIGSILYPFFDLWKPGTFIMGNYGLIDACVIFVGGEHPCKPIMIAPRIFMVGTSL